MPQLNSLQVIANGHRVQMYSEINKVLDEILPKAITSIVDQIERGNRDVYWGVYEHEYGTLVDIYRFARIVTECVFEVTGVSLNFSCSHPDGRYSESYIIRSSVKCPPAPAPA
ncbi:hypothetical protein EOL96_00360 [Candidatus Saccharibacteria bacterium]|nr:hypothetical protein [Candidatus Saccharibacteria bacterium]